MSEKKQPIADPQRVGSTFACMSLNMFDRLRMIQFAAGDIELVRQAIKKVWMKGIQEERNYHGAHEFKLKGNPWFGQGNDAVPSRSLMASVFSTLYNKGWILVASTDISKKQMDKDSFLFRLQIPPPEPCTWMAISFNRGDRLRLIDAPRELIEPFRAMLKPLLQQEGWKVPNAYEFKCRGYPWFAQGSEAVSTRIMLLYMLQILETQGFRLYASIDQNTGPGGDSSVSETDTWFCCRSLSWSKGTPVYNTTGNSEYYPPSTSNAMKT
jgi:hypothetical protein